MFSGDILIGYRGATQVKFHIVCFIVDLLQLCSFINAILYCIYPHTFNFISGLFFNDISAEKHALCNFLKTSSKRVNVRHPRRAQWAQGLLIAPSLADIKLDPSVGPGVCTGEGWACCMTHVVMGCCILSIRLLCVFKKIKSVGLLVC